MAEEEKEKVEETQPEKEGSRNEAKAPVEKPKEAPAEKPEKPKETPAGPVKPSNCTQCNKPLKRGNWYYRNGKFYCNKRCWKKTTEKVA